MDIKIELAKLYNSLLTIPTTGQHTKTMANCLVFIEQLIAHEEPKQEQAENKEEVSDKK